ncbi:O-methyltransferase MdmC-like isoform X2 [Biomphalaria glabrata]|nr:O-methyltransferase MdmC-like isoform X2 [Biomphalaria glabrata]XP_055896785.1 O-methyltransferase MdmC-like isoform X2 [Biomphalaria glabrata]XP_055896786.1 O-methyltransferase MdmC-like isoform X2 [Biomphalaria glabrata]
MSSTRRSMSHYDPAVAQVEKALQLAQSSNVPPELLQTLELACDLIQKRDDYTDSNTSYDSAACRNILEQTLKHDWDAVHRQGKTTWNLRPGMMTGRLEGQFLKSLVSIHKCKKILDIGMFTGYSALSMAEALPADGKLITLDQDIYLKELVEGQFFKQSPHGKKIEIRIGPAINTVKKLTADGEQFDIIFLDAHQGDYVEFLEYIFGQNLLVPGGTLLIDNAFVYGTGYTSNPRGGSANRFTDVLASNPNLHRVLVPLRDGILIVRRKSDVEGTVD